MLGATTFSENAIADQGILFFGVSEQSGISSSANAAVGIMSGVATMDGNFTVTTAGMYISGSTNAELSSSFTQTTEDIKIVNFTDATLSSAFTQTANGIMIGSGVATTDFNMTLTSSGDLLYEEIGSTTGKGPSGAPAPGAGYTEISPSGVESYSSITPSGSETWTEI